MNDVRWMMRVLGLVGVVVVLGCSGDDGDDRVSPTAPAPVDEEVDESDSGVTLGTVPVRTGTLDLELAGESYRLDVDICDLSLDGLEFLAYGDDEDPPIRVEYSSVGDRRLFVAIDPANVIDPGTVSWVGEPELELGETTAVANDFAMTDLDGNTAAASIDIDCPEI